MLNYFLLLLIVFGPALGQRDVVVNRRARQPIQPSKLEEFTEKTDVRRTRQISGESYWSAARNPLLDTYSKPKREASRRRQRARVYTEAPPTFATSDVGTPFSSYESETPYYELGASDRQSYQSVNEFGSVLSNSEYSEQPYSQYSDTNYQLSEPAYPSDSGSNNYETPYSGYADPPSRYEGQVGETPYLERGASARRRVNNDRQAAAVVRDTRPTTSRRRTSSYGDRATGATAAAVTASDRSDDRSTAAAAPIRRRPSTSRRVRQRARVPAAAAVDNTASEVRTNEISERASTRSAVRAAPRRTASYDSTGTAADSSRTSSGRSPSRSRTRLRGRVSRVQDTSSTANAYTQPPQTQRPATSRSRGRSRFVSRVVPSRSDPETQSFQRSNAIPQVDKFSNRRLDVTERSYSSDRSRLRSGSRASSRSFESQPKEKSQQKYSDPSSQSFKVKFPRKNLPGLPKLKFRAELAQSPTPTRNRYKDDIKPTKPRLEKVETTTTSYTEYTDTNIQSSREDKDMITVTHQVPTKTVFTIVEGKETKSLYIDTFTPSLQLVSIRDLKSTYIEDSPVIYAFSTTSLGYGVQETLYDGIHPTRTELDSPTSYARGARDTALPASQYSTIYNVQTVTIRNHDALGSITPDITNIGSLLQNVILGILGSQILGGPALLGNAGLLGGAGVAQTQLKTHTKSFLTTATLTETSVIPIIYQGRNIYSTITDTEVKTLTETSTSIETIIQPGLVTSKPFLPLAPTLHRATRVVQTLPTFPLVGAEPEFSVITHTRSSLTTIETEETTDFVVTLRGKEITTKIIQPTKQVLTVTTFSTETVAVPPQTSQASPLNQLSLLRAILQLNQLQG